MYPPITSAQCQRFFICSLRESEMVLCQAFICTWLALKMETVLPKVFIYWRPASPQRTRVLEETRSTLHVYKSTDQSPADPLYHGSESCLLSCKAASRHTPHDDDVQLWLGFDKHVIVPSEEC